MNRIYQGKVTKVEIRDGEDTTGKPKWKPLENWPGSFWAHHELFQDAVNYYTLALAAMAQGLEKDMPETRAFAVALRASMLQRFLKA